MRKTDGFVMRRLGNEAMIVAESIRLVDFDRIVSLNSSAAYIWESLPATDFTAKTIADMLTRRYDVDDTVALRDAEDLLTIWLEAGIIEE